MLKNTFITAHKPGSKDQEEGKVENDKGLLQKLQDFELPKVIQADIASWICVANTLAITTALFAAVQISLNAIVEQLLEGRDSTAWRVLRWFMYASVLINIGGTASAISVVNLASSLPNEARSCILNKQDSVPRKWLTADKPLPESLLRAESTFSRLEAFGMPKIFSFITRAMLFSFFFGSFSLFVSLYLWVFLTQTRAAAAALVPAAIPALSLVFSVIWY
ncbi:hypothetical protein FRC17_009035 [Serendipita sp. 399]|nr:hypothetical protein FRC17_009035 [Serendipita sp. 399]